MEKRELEFLLNICCYACYPTVSASIRSVCNCILLFTFVTSRKYECVINIYFADLKSFLTAQFL